MIKKRTKLLTVTPANLANAKVLAEYQQWVVLCLVYLGVSKQLVEDLFQEKVSLENWSNVLLDLDIEFIHSDLEDLIIKNNKTSKIEFYWKTPKHVKEKQSTAKSKLFLLDYSEPG